MTISVESRGDRGSDGLEAKGDQKTLDRIRRRWRYHVQAWRDQRKEREINMRALSPEGPLDPKERQLRADAGRQWIHLDQLTQYTNGFMGQVEQSPLAIKVEPAGGGATDESAELRADRLRRIEYETDAPDTYLTALQCATEGSYGAFGMTLDYRSWDSRDLVIVFRTFENPDQVSWDPDCKNRDWSDMQDAFVVSWMSYDDYKDKYDDEDAPLSSFGAFCDDFIGAAPEWINSEAQMVMVVEYWAIEKRKRTVLFPKDEADNRRWLKDELPDGVVLAEKILSFPTGEQVVVKSESRDEPYVMQYIVGANGILDKNDTIPGQEIPIFPITGPVRWISDGHKVKRLIYSYIRMAIDAQLLFDYYKSTEAEDIGLTPKPKWIGFEGQFDTATDWTTASKSTDAYVEFKPIVDAAGGQVLPLPQWQTYQPNTQALEIGGESARRAIQAAVGKYGATKLDDTNVKSGRAIDSLDKQGDIPSFPLINSYKRAVKRAGRVANIWLDHIEGQNPAEVGIRKEDGTNKVVKINQPSLDDGGKPQFLQYRESEDARHDVTVSAGPSHDSQRQEAKEFGANLMSSGLPQVPAILPVLIKAQNLGPLGDEMADRAELPKFKDNQGEVDAQQVQQMQQQYEAALSDAMKQIDQFKQGLPKIQSDQQIAQAKIEADKLISMAKIEADQQNSARADSVKLAIAEIQSQQKIQAEELTAFIQKMDHALELLMQERDHRHEAAMGERGQLHEKAMGAADAAAAERQAKQAATQSEE